MARMVAPFTGVVHEVAASKVAARLAAGYVPLDGAPDHAPAPVDEGTEGKPAEPTDRPTAESTIAEIRAWAKANGVALPKRGNKAQLLAAIG